MPANLLAQVGERYVTVEELFQRAELSPPPSFRTVNGYSSKRGLLELLIGEKLLANEAATLQWDREEAFKQWRHYTENLAIAKQLYREQVLGKIDLHEGEIDTAIMRAQKSLRMKFFRSSSREEAERFARLAHERGAFDHVMQMLSGPGAEATEYTSNFTFGDGDELLEDAVFALPVGQISQVILTARGFFVVQVLGGQHHLTFSQQAYSQQRTAVQKILRRRAADRLSAQYVQQFMRDKKVVLKGRVFSLLAEALSKHLDFEMRANLPALQPLEEIDYDQTEQELGNLLLDDALIIFAGGQWTMREALEKLRLRNLPFDRQSLQAMRETLENDLQSLVRDEFLAEEGRRRGLNKHPAVSEETRMWVDHHLYTRMVQRLELQPQKGETIHFPAAVLSLKEKYGANVYEENLQAVEISDIKLMAVHPGRPHLLAVPLWPLF
ncbi:MAG: peptidylprolyl isomerase [bacterium]